MADSILITGGTGKVGFQLVKHFLSRGYNVVTTSRSVENINKIKNKLPQTENFYPLIVNLEDKGASYKVYEYCEDQKIEINVIINTARNLSYLTIEDGRTTYSNWIGEYLLDVIVPYELSMQFSEKCPNALQTIINISSMYGVVAPNPILYNDFNLQSPINYGVSKAAQIHLTKELAVRLSSKKITVNSISFGGIKGRVDNDFLKRYANLTPSGEMLEEDVIGAVDFLVSSKSKHINGHNIVVDGGWTIW